MNDVDASVMAQLPEVAFAVVLLIARIGCACMLLPGIGEAQLPMTVRAALALALVALVGPVVAPLMPAAPPPLLPTLGMVVAEVVTGLWFGWLTRLLLITLPIAGQMIASFIGLANVLQPDPALGAQSSALSRMLGLAAPVAVFAAGLHVPMLSALVGSYRVIPVGTMLAPADAVETVIRGVSGSFALALRLAAPFVLAGTLWHVALGVVARLVPNLQVFFMTTAGQILGGLLLLGWLAADLLETWQGQVADGLNLLPGL